MITAIDTSVLLIIARKEPRWEKWRMALTKAASEGPLVVCCVVFGEFSLGYDSENLALERLNTLHIHYDPIRPQTARAAYSNYLKGLPYRNPEPHLLPYHLINAHASLQADRLAVDSRLNPRHYHSTVQLLPY
jgi:predicted nucleic acid-binding protein